METSMTRDASDTDCSSCACPRESLDDEEVVRRVRAGETDLFELIMRRYNQRLYRVARSILRDDGEAEDVMQQAYVNAYTHIDQFAGAARFSTWLTRIAVHEALARARRRTRLKELDSMQDANEAEPVALRDERPDPERQAHTAELRAMLESAIDALPEHYRSVFVLREAEGLDTLEVAECLEISGEAVRQRLSRARALLRRRIFAATGESRSAAFAFHLSRCDRVVNGVMPRLRASASSPGPGPGSRATSPAGSDPGASRSPCG
jgi:RNA polymerase sigma-70 factor (ECF subfamily)